MVSTEEGRRQRGPRAWTAWLPPPQMLRHTSYKSHPQGWGVWSGINHMANSSSKASIYSIHVSEKGYESIILQVFIVHHHAQDAVKIYSSHNYVLENIWYVFRYQLNLKMPKHFQHLPFTLPLISGCFLLRWVPELRPLWCGGQT